eukprot:CFRG1568T1
MSRSEYLYTDMSKPCIVGALILMFVTLRFVSLWVGGVSVSSDTPKRTKTCSTLIVLGSGGHTAEMVRLLQTLSLDNYTPRTYVLAETDTMSEGKILELERASGSLTGKYCFRRIPRSREVGQSYTSSVISTIRSQLYCIPLIMKAKPELILGNGPGTCVPIFFLSFLLQFFFIRQNVKTMYVESIARVRHLSLTGRILYHCRLCSNFLVQWPQLVRPYPRAIYVGRLV